MLCVFCFISPPTNFRINFSDITVSQCMCSADSSLRQVNAL